MPPRGAPALHAAHVARAPERRCSARPPPAGPGAPCAVACAWPAPCGTTACCHQSPLVAAPRWGANGSGMMVQLRCDVPGRPQLGARREGWRGRGKYRQGARTLPGLACDRRVGCPGTALACSEAQPAPCAPPPGTQPRAHTCTHHCHHQTLPSGERERPPGCGSTAGRSGGAARRPGGMRRPRSACGRFCTLRARKRGGGRRGRFQSQGLRVRRWQPGLRAVGLGQVR